MAFSLTKWYLDVVTEEGGVAIAYWGELRWGRLRPRFSGVFVDAGAGVRTSWRWSGQVVAPPVPDANGLAWSAAPLAVAVAGTRHEAGFARRLLETPQGTIDWCCELPRAAMRIQVGDRVLEGLGYAERLDLTLLPWRIPADEIRWGRFLAPGASVVWIEWRGETPRQVVFRDGQLVAATLVSEAVVAGSDGWKLALEERRVLSDDRMGGLLAPLELLRSVVRPIAKVQQTRWLSRGTLQAAGTGPIEGWAIHELVRWR